MYIWNAAVNRPTSLVALLVNNFWKLRIKGFFLLTHYTLVYGSLLLCTIKALPELLSAGAGRFTVKPVTVTFLNENVHSEINFEIRSRQLILSHLDRFFSPSESTRCALPIFLQVHRATLTRTPHHEIQQRLSEPRPRLS